jgi:D-sedoheptulose 7-phosphate isomerase
MVCFSRKGRPFLRREDLIAQIDEGDGLRGHLRDRLDRIEAIAGAVVRCLNSGGVIYLCGNGGSAADAQHIAAEFVVRLSADHDRPGLPAVALTTDTSILTAGANDYGYERVFARQIETLGNPGDVLIGLSTSGNSANVYSAMKAARDKKLVTVGLLGGDGGNIEEVSDYSYIVDSRDPGRVQEIHIVIAHMLVYLIERSVSC